MKNGFVTLIGLLVAVFIIAVIVWGIGNKNEDPKAQIDIYNDAVLDAEDIKKVIEDKNNLENNI
jgi:hypothetical protein